MLRSMDTNQQHDQPPETMMERHQRILRRLADLAMQLAEAEQVRAFARMAREPVPGEPDPLLSFNRIAHTVRQTVMLEAKLEKERQKQADFEAEAQFTCDLAAVTLREAEAKQQVARAVEQAIR